MDTIYHEAQQLAMEFSRTLRNRRTELSYECDSKAFTNLHKEYIAQKSEEEIMKRKIQEDEEDLKYEINLMAFVRDHVYFMLRDLYKHIKKEEEGFLISDVKNETSQHKESTSRAREWFKRIYSAAQNNSKKGIKVVGPVGERPLHVCALSMHRFEEVDFQGRGRNYFTKGVMHGMIKFIEVGFGSEPNAQSSIWEEVTAPYEKDYCAALGSFLASNKELLTAGADLVKNREDFSEARKLFGKANLPPYFKDIWAWTSIHVKKTSYANISKSKSFSNELATKGIYEGETILYPLIAGNDEAMIKWLLAQERKMQDGAEKVNQSQSRCAQFFKFLSVLIQYSANNEPALACSSARRLASSFTPCTGAFLHPSRLSKDGTITCECECVMSISKQAVGGRTLG
jgi:hypothetical protein